MELINRPLYLQQLQKLRDRNAIKILVGARGVGKTSLLDIFAQDLKDSGVNSKNIVRVDFDTINFQNLDATDLLAMLTAQIPKSGKTYLLLDEISQIKNWQEAIVKVKKDFDADIYLSSSVELAEIAAPTITVNVLPLSFREFQDFYNFADDVSQNERFAMYLKFGGMPAVIKTLPDISAAISILSNDFYASILRDVVSGSKITDFDLMIGLIKKIFVQVGKIQSYNKFSKMFEQNPPAVRTVENYVDHLCAAHMLHSLSVTDLRRDNTLKRLAKYYPVDFGYSTLMIGEQEISQEILENAVYAELLRRGYEVSAYRVKDSLVFQVERGEAGDRIYINVVKHASLSSFVPLRAVKNLFAKWVITADEDVADSGDGIKVVNVLDFLMSK